MYRLKSMFTSWNTFPACLLQRGMQLRRDYSLGATPMTVSQSIAPHLPSLRRFARALSGSQESGDAYVVALLEALAEDPSMFPLDMDSKIALYKLFLKIWNSVDANAFPAFRLEQTEAMRGLQSLTPKPRQAFLLLSVEGFDASAIAKILDTDAEDAAALV